MPTDSSSVPTDVDECSLNNTIHGCDQICINTNDGFNCSCEEGYVLANNGKSCEGMCVCMHVSLCQILELAFRSVTIIGARKTGGAGSKEHVKVREGN